ncbi:hypothetical protein [Enterococcus sp. ZJ1668]|uniref:hypothetical protein n=1 Tax=Enterococcus sp. ZJ1668 TaxID=2709402 RepID=UPI0013EAF392|nr:hypothetical protein [Enterococcus sp. ZJ1668]
MRRMEKEFKKKMVQYIKVLKELGNLEFISKQRYFDICWHSVDLHASGEFYWLAVEYDKIDSFGEIELQFYYDNTFGISKYQLPFYVNDCLSLMKIVEIFFGTPFDLQIEKIRTCLLSIDERLEYDC